MATTILILMVVLLIIAATPWIGATGYFKVHKADLMAGDEGED